MEDTRDMPAEAPTLTTKKPIELKLVDKSGPVTKTKTTETKQVAYEEADDLWDNLPV